MNPGSSVRLVSLDSSSMSYFLSIILQIFSGKHFGGTSHSADCSFLYIFSCLPLSSLTSQGKRVLCFIDEVTEA